MTENYAALDILKHYLSGVDSSQTLNTADVKQETMEPFVLFGSSFPKDKEYTQVMVICRLLHVLCYIYVPVHVIHLHVLGIHPDLGNKRL